MNPILPADWRLDGEGYMTDKQRRLLNAACGDLAEHLPWHEKVRLSKDDYRHMVSGTLLGWRTIPAIDLGFGPAGWIMLGGSSLQLTRSEATDAITLAFHLGDHPEEQHIDTPAVSWCTVVRLARGIPDSELEVA